MPPSQRDDAAYLRDRLEAIDGERAKIEAERAEVAKRLGSYGRPIELESLRVASPCQADWNKMAGDHQVRFCSGCQKNVYNLAGMTRDEAMALVRQNEGGEVCLRLHRRADGTVLTSDCPDGARRKRRRLALLGAGSGVMAAVAGVAASAWPARQACPIEESVPALMGSTPLPSPSPPSTGASLEQALPDTDAPPQALPSPNGSRPPQGGPAQAGGKPKKTPPRKTMGVVRLAD
jgi:hypothetical protein